MKGLRALFLNAVPAICIGPLAEVSTAAGQDGECP
jgi:hypothetical protein